MLRHYCLFQTWERLQIDSVMIFPHWRTDASPSNIVYLFGFTSTATTRQGRVRVFRGAGGTLPGWVTRNPLGHSHANLRKNNLQGVAWWAVEEHKVAQTSEMEGPVACYLCYLLN